MFLGTRERKKNFLNRNAGTRNQGARDAYRLDFRNACPSLNIIILVQKVRRTTSVSKLHTVGRTLWILESTKLHISRVFFYQTVGFDYENNREASNLSVYRKTLELQENEQLNVKM